MMRILIAFAAASLTGLAATSHAQTLTIAEARALPVEEIARRVLGGAGQLYAEVARPGPEAGWLRPVGGRVGLLGLAFAAAPRASGWPGLCRSDVAYVSFRSLRPATEADPDPPAAVSGLSTRSRYRIEGNIDRREQRTSEYERQLERDCRSAGAVLQTDVANPRYFSGSAFGSEDMQPSQAWFVARAFQEVRRRAAAGSVRPTCRASDEQELCENPARRIAELDPGRLHRATLYYCGPRETRLCVEAIYKMPGSTVDAGTDLELTIETNSPSANRPAERVDVRGARIRIRSWIV